MVLFGIVGANLTTILWLNYRKDGFGQDLNCHAKNIS
jgi:hypothetical protein